MKKSTSWDEQAEWYGNLLADPDSYQEKVIKPNLIRLMAIRSGETVLDLACGNGFFSVALAEKGANVIGIDSSVNLIAVAKKNNPKINFRVAEADNLFSIKNNAIDQIICVMAIQNMDNVKGALAECKRVLKPDGKLHIVMNHPAFRVLKQSSWGWDEEKNIQFRRIDHYLSESKISIQMHPGDKPEETTTSFHRPLQYYFKLLKNNGFAVANIEEWISNRRSQPGPKAKAENISRQEIPLFLYMQVKII